jgi:hypothetical protein
MRHKCFYMKKPPPKSWTKWRPHRTACTSHTVKINMKLPSSWSWCGIGANQWETVKLAIRWPPARSSVCTERSAALNHLLPQPCCCLNCKAFTVTRRGGLCPVQLWGGKCTAANTSVASRWQCSDEEWRWCRWRGRWLRWTCGGGGAGATRALAVLEVSELLLLDRSAWFWWIWRYTAHR